MFVGRGLQIFVGFRRLYLVMSMVVLCVALLAGCGSRSLPQSSSGANTAPSGSNPAQDREAAPKPGPKKIAVMYFPYAEHLFAIGRADAVKGVVGLKSLRQFSVYDPYVSGDRIIDLGDQANLEKIMEMNPDLIIASQFEEQIVEQLSKIAKTVTVNTNLDWQETIKQVAALIDEEAKAQAYIDNFRKKQAEVTAVMEQSGQHGQTALFMMLWKNGFNYWGNPRMSLYYDKLGFKQPGELKNIGQIDLEGVSQMNPDYIFIGNDYTNASEISMKELETNPVWQALGAVKNKKVFIVDTEILGPLAMGQYKGLEFMEKLMKSAKQ